MATAKSGRQLSLSTASTAGYKRFSKCVPIAATRCPPAENPSTPIFADRCATPRRGSAPAPPSSAHLPTLSVIPDRTLILDTVPISDTVPHPARDTSTAHTGPLSTLASHRPP